MQQNDLHPVVKWALQHQVEKAVKGWTPPQVNFGRRAKHKQYANSTYNTLPQYSSTYKCRNNKYASFEKSFDTKAQQAP